MADRLDKRLARGGVGTRRQVATLVRRGRVTVDGAVVRAPGTRVEDGAEVAVDGEVLTEPPELLAWHKPVGVVSTLDDPWGREGLDDVLPLAWRTRFHPVGRLDRDTSGLLLFSRDGQLTQRLLHPRHQVPRRYEATVSALPEGLGDALAAGVETSMGTFPATLVSADPSTGRVVVEVTEGKHRMVRRVLANAGAPVETLHRSHHGPVALGKLAPRALREVTADEVAALRTLTGG